ncbi:YncE family protein [Nibrella saemangeumensis]|uniref:YncE family protein n=1 Tax=Nibrella saemangeumensis TaxID=1084526 RepID=UPI0031EE6434
MTVEPYESGVLVLEEGGFTKGNASVSFINRQTGQITPDIFKKVNSRAIGDVLQSYTELAGRGYLVVNNSNKVEIVDANTFKSVGSIEAGVDQCRYIVPVSNEKAYVSCWGNSPNGSVAVVDLANKVVVKQVMTGVGPEGMLVKGSDLYVANSGGFDTDNTVSIINTQTDAVTSTITVGDVPTHLVIDRNQDIWVLCSGKPTWNSPDRLTKAELIRINSSTKQIVGRITIGGKNINGNPDNLIINGDGTMLYFTLNNAVYSMPVSAATAPIDTPLIRKNLYGLGYDNATNTIYGAYAGDFSQNGYVYRYRTGGQVIDSLRVGLIPSGFYFK